jgi:hypothetical protein
MIGFPTTAPLLCRPITVCLIISFVLMLSAYAADPAAASTKAGNPSPAVSPTKADSTARHIPAKGLTVSPKKDTVVKEIVQVKKVEPIKEIIQEPAGATHPSIYQSNDSGDIHMSIKSVPDSIQVFIDGNLAGTTPFETNALQAGTHAIELKAEGYKDFRKEIYFAPLSRKKITVRMASVYASLAVRGIPSGAEVSLNGTMVSTTPFDTAKLAPGQYTVSFNLAQYLPYQTQLTAEQNKGDPITAVLVSKAYDDSVKATAKKNRQMARRILFGIAASGFTLAGILTNKTAQEHLDSEASALAEYNRPNLLQDDYTLNWNKYKSEQKLADQSMRSRNILYGIAGAFIIAFGISIPF